MIKSTLKISLVALVIAATFSCKNDKKDIEVAGEVAEASNDADSYSVDTNNSEILWIGKKPLGQHNGTIQFENGSFYVKDGNIESGKFIIDMNTITVNDLEGDDKASLEGHLKGFAEGKEDHFFDVKNHPKATFEITESAKKDDIVNIKGNLTVKGKTNPVEFIANVTTENGVLTLKTDPIIINRTKWAVNYGSKSVFDDLGDKFISDDIEIVLNIVAKQ